MKRIALVVLLALGVTACGGRGPHAMSPAGTALVVGAAAGFIGLLVLAAKSGSEEPAPFESRPYPYPQQTEW